GSNQQFWLVPQLIIRAKSPWLLVIAEISRVSRYNDQVGCVTGRSDRLEYYCFCRSLLPATSSKQPAPLPVSHRSPQAASDRLGSTILSLLTYIVIFSVLFCLHLHTILLPFNRL